MNNSPATLAYWLGLFLFSIYLLTLSGKLHVMDELAVFTAGNSLVQHGRADINPLIWTNHWTPHPPGIWGDDNNLYTKKAPGISVIASPLIWLGHALPTLNVIHVTLLTNSLLTALTAALLFIWLTDVGFTRQTALLTGLGYGLCTIAWVYARMLWGLSVLGLCFLVAVWSVQKATARPNARLSQKGGWLFLSGLALAIGLTLRFEASVAVLLIGIYLLMQTKPPTINILTRLRTLRKSGLTNLPAYAVLLSPMLLTVIGLAYFNLQRYGSLTETGYTQEILFLPPWVGGFGLLFSPGNGLFFFSPFMLLLFLGLHPAWRRLPRPDFVLISGLCLFYWGFYGSWFAWGGTWGWGPRFMLPILPLMMIFVACALDRAIQDSPNQPQFVRQLTRALACSLAFLSLIINFLGVAVDFNEHFLRLGRNDNFVYNWAAFPPLGHWQILQEGLTDLLWLPPSAAGLTVQWPMLGAGGLTIFMAASGLMLAVRRPQSGLQQTVSIMLSLILTLMLTYTLLHHANELRLSHPQTQLDKPLLDTLNQAAQPHDSLLMPMPPFADAQEISALLMSDLDRPLPLYAWIESLPRAITPIEREQVWQAATRSSERIWLFERWLTQADGLSPTARRLGQEAFLLESNWFEGSGKLSLYALNPNPPVVSQPMAQTFQGGLTLESFALMEQTVSSGQVVQLRLTWHAPPTVEGMGNVRLIAFVHLVDPISGQNLAQQDRLLLDLQVIEQAPLRPGQTVKQGYGLSLPTEVPPGRYPLIIGLYQADSGQRLRRLADNGDDFLYLADVVVR